MPENPGQSDPLSAKQLTRLETLFHEALSLPPDDRSAWVDEHLADDADQARMLKSMLAHDQADTTGLTQAMEGFTRDSAAPRDRSGEKIDRYRLISRIRYGGMAEVYRAARDDGQFDHEVALKVIRSDRARPALNELFAAERALMARLKHPHITQIFDGGTTAQGEAYFVMELLDGLPLPTAIASSDQNSRAILNHLSNLCSALNHVHGRLIVHRDIKPENVLLCRTPEGLIVKLLDFGIAAQLSAGIRPGDDNEHVPSAERWHSPGYVAPESLDGQPSGAAADIYSLGKLILDCVAQMQPRFREELRAIGDKASHDDPEQRYAGVVAVAEDLDRMRRGEPISLLRHRRGYVMRRALQRHRWAVAACMVLLVAGSTWLWRESNLRLEAEQATARAEIQRDRAEAMRDFLLDAFDSSNPSLNRGEEPRVSDLIIDQLELLEEADELDPESRVELLVTFGDLLVGLDRRELAERALAQASEVMASQGSQGGLRWTSTTVQRGVIASRDGRFDDAAELFEQAESALAGLPPSLDRARLATTLYGGWGANEQRRGRLGEAEHLIRLALETTPILQEADDPAGDDPSLLVTLGAIQSARGNMEGALETFEMTYEQYLGNGHSGTFEHLALLGWLGITLNRLDRPTSAEPYLVEAVELAEQLFHQPNSRLSGSYNNLAHLYLNLGRLSEAESLVHRALKISRAAGNADTPTHASRLSTLGSLTMEAEQFDQAIETFEQVLQLQSNTLGPTHRHVLSTRLTLASARAEVGADLATLNEVEALAETFEQNPLRIDALLLTARLAAERGFSDQAEAACDAATELRNATKASATATARTYWLEGRAREAMSQPDAARTAYLTAADLYRQSGREQYPTRGRALLHAALLTPDNSPERINLGDQARAILTPHLQPPSPSLRLLDSL